MKTLNKIALLVLLFTSGTTIAQFTFYRDNDGDGWGGSSSISSSYPPPGYVANNLDCNDNNSSIGKATTWYRDADGDGLGNPNVSTTSCSRPNGYVSNDDDLDDSDGNINDTGPWYFYYDNDGDGYGTGTNTFYGSYPPPGYVDRDGDCNDNNVNVNPGRTEICGDGIDNNCNGQTDENDPVSPPLPTTSSADFCGSLTITRADPPSGVTYYWQTGVLGTSTANSAKTRTFTSGYQQYIYLRARNNQGCWGPPAVYIQYTVPQPPAQPGTVTVTNNCAATVLTRPNPPSGVTYYWQTSATGTNTSNSSPSVTRTSGTVYYLRAKKNNVNCWGQARTVNYTVDPAPRWYVDNDGDGYGGNSSITSCSQPSGYVNNNHDLDDNDPSITDVRPWYRDADGDQYGTSSNVIYQTYPSSGYVDRAGDCNDNNSSVNPGATEICGDGLDNDCNGQVDENNPATPPAPSVNGTCGSTTITRADPPPGVTYYWQTGMTGESTANDDKTRTFTTGYLSNIYLRALNSDGCWSDNTSQATFSVPQPGDAPPTPTIDTSVCGQVTLTRPDPDILRTYYWQSEPDGTSTDDSSKTITLTSGNVYYLRSKPDNSPCWSDYAQVNYTINQGSVWYLDADGDGHAVPGSATNGCSSPGTGYVNTSIPDDDCNDGNPSITGPTIWYSDADNDGLGDPASPSTPSCAPPAGYVSNSFGMALKASQ